MPTATELRRTLVLLVAPLLAAPPAHAAEQADVEKGRAMAERLCAICHMTPGQGEKDGPRGIPSFRAVANRPHQKVEDVVVWLRSVPPMMPDHHLTQDEAVALAAFIMSLREQK